MSKITEIMCLLEFPQDAKDFFEDLLLKIQKDPSLTQMLCDLRELYFEKFNCDELKNGLSELSQKTVCHQYCTDMLFMLFCAPRLEKIYADKGYSHSFFVHNIKDLYYKAMECKKVHGFYGMMNISWQEGLFKLSRFALGRLQYNHYKTLFDYKDIVKKGDDVIYIHIPSSGPLLPEQVQESFRMAYDFYGPNYGKKLVLMTNTWMLYPPMAKEVFTEGSNLRAFYELFDVISESEDVTDSNIWRVFNVKTDDYSLLPRETGLQKRLYKYLGEGKHTGFGYGMIVYSPEE